MKKILFLTLGLFVFSVVVFADSYRTTASDLYIAGYNAQMREHREFGTEQARAEAYRERLETCDAHHNCGVTEAKPAAPAREKKHAESRSGEGVDNLLVIPIWG